MSSLQIALERNAIVFIDVQHGNGRAANLKLHLDRKGVIMLFEYASEKEELCIKSILECM
ncbi:MAG: hypothetical protein H7A37_06285 [Chlamydiales bacterium]|nr:hypothetical protein [Chlamydiales bacterium]